jgi:hypothetical protein
MDRTLGPHHLLRTNFNKLVVTYSDTPKEQAVSGPSKRELLIRQLIAATAALDGMLHQCSAHGSQHHKTTRWRKGTKFTATY